MVLVACTDIPGRVDANAAEVVAAQQLAFETVTTRCGVPPDRVRVLAPTPAALDTYPEPCCPALSSPAAFTKALSSLTGTNNHVVSVWIVCSAAAPRIRSWDSWDSRGVSRQLILWFGHGRTDVGSDYSEIDVRGVSE